MSSKQHQDTPFTAGIIAPLPSAFSLYRLSITAMLSNIWTFVLLLVIPCIFAMSGSILNYMSSNRDTGNPTLHGISIGLIVVGIVLGILVLPALFISQLKSAKQEVIEVDEALREARHIFWRYFGLMFCLGFIYVISLLLLVVPFFFAIRRYLLAPYYLIDQNLGIREALRASAADSRIFSRPIWGLIGVQAINGFLAGAPLIGWLLDAAYYCAPAIRYQQIQEASQKIAKVNEKLAKTAPKTKA